MNREHVEALVAWYGKNARALPWRQNKDPYRIWVSEIMLQQTRVEAVKPYFNRFLERFPTVVELAAGTEEELLKLWEGLGYYSRVRNMQKAAVLVCEQHGGAMPLTYDTLVKLPGIGPYTAGAIASIAGGEPVPAVDGNVLRIITRLEGDYSNISEPATVRKIREILLSVMPADAGTFNQALMELGAVVCLPNGAPKCGECPWKETCEARAGGVIGELPVKAAARARTIEKRTLILLEGTAGIALRKRGPGGLLAGMYELPAIEGHCKKSEVLQYVKEMGYHPLQIKKLESYVHVFTHKEWHMEAYRILIDEIEDGRKTDEANKLFFVDGGEIAMKYPLPSAFAPYRKYISGK